MRPVPLLAIVIPCLNEQEVLPHTAAHLLETLEALAASGHIAPESFLLVVDDGSTDDTWPLLRTLHTKHPRQVRALRLSRNFGHQPALLAGMQAAARTADVVITLDADLQDDTRILQQMLNHYHNGCDIVYGVRNSRAEDSLGKRLPARLYYRFLRLAGVNIIFDHGDFRLVSRKALRALGSYREVNLFLRGIFPAMGFQSATVHYSRQARQAGRSKYSLRKLAALGLSGITAFSTVPLRLVTLLGLLTFLVSLGLSGYALWSYFTRQAVPGWASTVLSTYLIGGVQLLSIGIIGEYLARIYQEVKDRPRYIVDEELGT
ncbi:MAG: glycosyltransferase family 2 protein [Bacteroidetes bacterium]|nr:glycosyltransferase family 2 protein [Bacteroidota bacterium]